MAMFGQINSSTTITQLQQKFSTLFRALEDLEDSYQWSSAYALADFQAPPMNLSAADAQIILDALADAHDFYQTGMGVAGFPLPALPYNFLASMRKVAGTR